MAWVGFHYVRHWLTSDGYAATKHDKKYFAERKNFKLHACMDDAREDRDIDTFLRPFSGRVIWLPYPLVQDLFPTRGKLGIREWAAQRGMSIEDQPALERLGLVRSTY